MARHQLTASLAALDHGNSKAAQEGRHEIENQLGEADELVRLSLETLEKHSARLAELQNHHQEISATLPQAEKRLQELQTDYSPGVVLFSTREGKPVTGQDSITNSVVVANSKLDSAKETLALSETAFAEGRLIAAVGLLERAGNELGFANRRREGRGPGGPGWTGRRRAGAPSRNEWRP